MKVRRQKGCFFLSNGRVSASIQLDHKRRHQLSASAAGWAFGESALLHEKRTADIFADTDVNLLTLRPERLMANDGPLATRLMIKVHCNLVALILNLLGKADREIRILTRQETLNESQGWGFGGRALRLSAASH